MIYMLARKCFLNYVDRSGRLWLKNFFKKAKKEILVFFTKYTLFAEMNVFI